MEEKKRILDVDDDKAIREYLSRILEMEGYRYRHRGNRERRLKDVRATSLCLGLNQL